MDGVRVVRLWSPMVMGAIDVIEVVVMGGAEVLRDWAGRELTTQEEPAGTGG